MCIITKWIIFNIIARFFWLLCFFKVWKYSSFKWFRHHFSSFKKCNSTKIIGFVISFVNHFTSINSFSSTLILSISSKILGLSLSFDIKSFVDGNYLYKYSKDFKASTYFCPWSSIVFVCFSKDSPKVG